MQKQITIFCGCLIKDNQVLLVQRDEPECKEAHLKWEFPGGKVNFGETPEQSLEREFLEETGRKVRVMELLPFVQTAYWEYDWGTQQTLCFCYLCELITDGQPKVKDHHVKQISWIDLKKAKTLPALPGTTEILDIVEEHYSK